MSALTTVSESLCELLRCLVELASYVVLFVSASVVPRAQTAATIVALRIQLAACQQRVKQRREPRLRLRAAFRVLWVILSRALEGCEDLAQLMKPATVKRWHNQDWRLYWCWRSRRRGRPALDQEMRSLVRKLSREGPLWSAERIRDTLLLLGFDPPCEDPIRGYMTKPGRPREPSTTWLPFLRNQLDVSWAIDSFTVTTLNVATVYVFLVFEHGRRQVVHPAVTRSPDMAWVIQQLREAMPFGLQPRYLLRDNGGIYGHGVALFLQRCGIGEVRTALHSPWQNPYVERFIGTLRRELLNRVIVVNGAHLARLLGEFIEEYYHVARPHQGLGGDTPIPTESPAPLSGRTTLVATPVLGGLHHRYEGRTARLHDAWIEFFGGTASVQASADRSRPQLPTLVHVVQQRAGALREMRSPLGRGDRRRPAVAAQLPTIQAPDHVATGRQAKPSGEVWELSSSLYGH